jgi:hypothetical protein
VSAQVVEEQGGSRPITADDDDGFRKHWGEPRLGDGSGMRRAGAESYGAPGLLGTETGPAPLPGQAMAG